MEIKWVERCFEQVIEFIYRSKNKLQLNWDVSDLYMYQNDEEK